MKCLLRLKGTDRYEGSRLWSDQDVQPPYETKENAYVWPDESWALAQIEDYAALGLDFEIVALP